MARVEFRPSGGHCLRVPLSNQAIQQTSLRLIAANPAVGSVMHAYVDDMEAILTAANYILLTTVVLSQLYLYWWLDAFPRRYPGLWTHMGSPPSESVASSHRNMMIGLREVIRSGASSEDKRAYFVFHRRLLIWSDVGLLAVLLIPIIQHWFR
jgi:hypothetical protein